MSETEMILLQEVCKIYNGGKNNEVVALKDVNFKVDGGEMVCIQGPSGSGKTTLLSIIGCLFCPTSGGAWVAGKKVSRLPDHFLTIYRRELIGFVHQNFHLLEHLTVFENVTLPLLPLGVSPKLRAVKADVLLERFSIGHRRDFPISSISGGELQRVALVRALINEPPVIVADEPTAHLDKSLAVEVLSLFAELKREGKTLIISSHDPLVADFAAVDRTVRVVAGRLVGNG